ncbi:MAG: polysaccharide biosynthesis/export family protein, partial [Opitutaceae bacterium]
APAFDRTFAPAPPPAADSGAAAEPPAAAPLTGDARIRRAPWQKRLTLGPGDVLSFRLFGAPELTRTNVVVGPDGRVSYLEAEDIVAEGLTVDQLRARIDQALARYRRAPQAMVAPVAFRSKKYYILGDVLQKGAFILDRPVTVVEAVARARGFAAGSASGSQDAMPDFSRSFLSRNGRHVPVDFARLFLQGDLSQNVALQPGDYLYFAPPSAPAEIYVLGAVRLPGPVSFEGGASVLTAIADRGGFALGAWTRHVLLIRGSFEHPRLFTVDLVRGLEGMGPNLALKPGDIVYVAPRPWYHAERILDDAASAFVESATVTWADVHVAARTNGVVPTISP